MLRDPNKVLVLFAILLVGGIAVAKIVKERSIPVESIDSSFASCGRGGKSYLVQETWKNVGDRPIRTVYATIRVHNKYGQQIHAVRDYPIYSVSDSEPGIAPGVTYRPRHDEGYVVPFGTSRADGPHVSYGGITRTSEAGSK